MKKMSYLGAFAVSLQGSWKFVSDYTKNDLYGYVYFAGKSRLGNCNGNKFSYRLRIIKGFEGRRSIRLFVKWSDSEEAIEYKIDFSSGNDYLVMILKNQYDGNVVRFRKV